MKIFLILWVLAQNNLMLPDQFEKTENLDQKFRWVIFVSDMPAFKWVKDDLNRRGWKNEDLEKRHLAVVADVSAMPSFIRKFVALPRLRELPYRVFLDFEGQVTKAWPRKGQTVMILELEGYQWNLKHELNSKKEVQTLLDQWKEDKKTQ